MAFSKELLDEILKDCHGPDDFYGPQEIMKHLTKALVERESYLFTIWCKIVRIMTILLI
jgi:hypothetical protein